MTFLRLSVMYSSQTVCEAPSRQILSHVTWVLSNTCTVPIPAPGSTRLRSGVFDTAGAPGVLTSPKWVGDVFDNCGHCHIEEHGDERPIGARNIQRCKPAAWEHKFWEQKQRHHWDDDCAARCSGAGMHDCQCDTCGQESWCRVMCQ